MFNLTGVICEGAIVSVSRHRQFRTESCAPDGGVVEAIA